MEVQVERLEDLRPALAVGGAASPQRFLEPAKRLLVAVEQLDLELVEAAGHALVVQDRDRVVDDLGAVGADALAPCAQAGDRLQPRPLRCPARSASRSAGGVAAGPAFSSSSRAFPAGSFSCQRPLPFSRR